MSNTTVGSVYQKIIQDVGETSRVDFEESGVEEGVLEDMMKIWQAKLSQTGVAHFPWDPKPEPNPSPAVNTPNGPPQTATNYQQQTMAAPLVSQQKQQQQSPLPQYGGMPPSSNANGNGVSIKQEPLDGPQAPGNYPPPAAFNNAQSAQERAAMNLQHTYGQRAAASISAIHNTVPLQQQRPMQMQMPPMPHPQQPGQNGPPMQNLQQQHPMQRPNMAHTPQQAQEAYRQQMAQRTAQMMAAKNNANGGAGAGQTDGADEIQPGSIGTISRVNAQGEEAELGRIEIDHMIRRRIEAMGQSMEGGGLMRPIGKQVPASRSKNHRVGGSLDVASVPRNDGPDDDDDIKDEVDIKDEDAINSDLDDPEEKDMDDDEEDEGANTMLCMYDKVQRVKNKWKCVMKDGVITVDGKEFVFHKATGEYEW